MICIRNDGYPASLELRKLYEPLPDSEAEGLGQIRLIDESGEDYLFPADYFRPIELPPSLRRAVMAAS